MTRIALPIFDGFTALDAVGPYEVLSRLRSAEVVFLGTQRGSYRTDNGQLALVADASFDDLPDPEIIVVPGGRGVRRLISDARFVDWLRGAHQTSEWTTSVCTGALLLGAAGIIEGLDATTHWLELPTLAEYEARPVEQRVVQQGKVITAAGVSSGIDMALLLAAEIAGEEFARAIQLSIEYDPDPPFDSGSTSKARPETIAAVREAVRRLESGQRT